MSKSKYLFFFLLFFCLNSFGQISKDDSLQINKFVNKEKDSLANSQVVIPDSVQQKPFKINPKLATKRSAMIPGWGQLYIKQTWILPVIYGGFAVNGYFIVRWNKNYKAFKNEYFRVSAYNDMITKKNSEIIEKNKELKDPLPTEPLLTKGEVTLRGNTITYSLANLKTGTSFYRRNRDGSILILPVVWALNILEVNVAAHLKSFDLSDDISMKLEPSFSPNPINGLPIVGGKVVFAFK